MKVLVISDLEDVNLDLSQLEDPALRLVISCGDVFNNTYQELLQATKLPVLAVHGNHDDLVWPPGVIDLHLRTVVIDGVTFGGFEGAWRYKPKGHFLYDDEQVAGLLESFPRVDVFVAHNPMAGVHDINDGVHNGFRAFRDYVERKRPKVFLHGHSNRKEETTVGDTRVVCASHWANIEL